jgi:Fibronectin type III domain
MDQGLRFDVGPVVTTTRRIAMIKLKLELKEKNTAQRIAMGQNHITSMTGNATYPAANRLPSDVDIQTAQDNLVAAAAAVDAAETVWKQKILERDAAQEVWDTKFTSRAAYCEAATPGDGVALTSTGFPLRGTPAPIGALPAPGNLRAAAADNEGVMELRCNTVKGASSYEWECKVHDAVSAPWSAIKTSTTAKILVPGLTPGTLYAFRVRAIGSAGPGAWSDEASGRAP